MSVAGLKVVSNLFGVSEPPLGEVQFRWGGRGRHHHGLVARILAGLVPATPAVGIPIASVMRAGLSIS